MAAAPRRIAPEAQAQMSALSSTYEFAHAVELRLCGVVPEPVACNAARTAGYDAAAAVTTANGTRSDAAIGEARRRVIAYETTVREVL